MEQSGLVGKFVKTVDSGTDNTGVIYFMYPGFVQRDEVFYDNDYNVVYTGKIYNKLKDELVQNTKSFICVCNYGLFDIDFTSKETIVNILYSKWGKKPKEGLLDVLENISDYDFWQFFKVFWVTGKSNVEESDITLWDLYKVLGKQRYDILKTYFKLKENYSNNFIFSGTLSFIEKALNPDSVSSQNGRYLKMLSDFNKEYSNKVIPIIQRAYIMGGNNEYDKEYRTLWLLMQLGKGNMV